MAAAQRYVQRHVPGLLALLQTGHAVASLRDERLQLGPAAVTAARVRQRPQPTALTRRPRWLPEDEPQRPARPLPAPRPTSILPHLPIWQALGQPFPALQVQLLAAGRPAAQMRAVQFCRDRPSAMSVLILTERLLQCHRRREEALRQVVCAALVALQPAGGWLALAASMLLHPSTFTSAIRALALAPALPSGLAADLTWLRRRLDDGHPLRRERPLALAVLSRADDRDLRPAWRWPGTCGPRPAGRTA
ncbi:MAG: hypothetical protein KatS3mg057_0900 [Herpetosiphonaceae bacterium]|nr:MAG: hypothetical protein KatS3mg057_0900 [Herpetosiphonaceae bacterium]